jgi:hypothetical protein
MVVKTYRGLLADGGQDQLRLQTIKGKVGYRIVKFQIIQKEPGEVTIESTVKIYKSQQSTINNTINFSDGELLAVAVWHKSSSDAYAATNTIIFENEIFNQDVYVTHDTTVEVGGACNYYLELEAIPLTDQGAEYTTLKDIRTQLTIS